MGILHIFSYRSGTSGRLQRGHTCLCYVVTMAHYCVPLGEDMSRATWNGGRTCGSTSPENMGPPVSDSPTISLVEIPRCPNIGFVTNEGVLYESCRISHEGFLISREH